MIYLDNAATTRTFDCAIGAAEVAMRDMYYNPNATYKQGVESKTAIEEKRRAVAELIGAHSDEIKFTSGATEANNWVFCSGRKNPKGNIVISAGEHASVYEPAMFLKSRGVDVRIVPLLSSGAIDVNAFEKAVDKNTTLISVIHVSNETGAVNPIKRLSQIAKSVAPRALFHSDGVQAFLKIHEPIDSLGVDLYSAGGHKIGAPKGIGLLYVRRGITLSPMLHGGGQEDGARSGTQNTPYIYAFADAARHFCDMSDRAKTSAMRDDMARYFTENGFKIIGSGKNSGYVLCVCIPGVKAEILQNAVNERGVIIGKGSACSGARRGNRVLSAIGLGPEDVECCARISFFVDTSSENVMEAAKIITESAENIRSGNVR